VRTSADAEYNHLEMLAPSIILALLAMFSLGWFFMYQVEWAARWHIHVACALVFAATTAGVHYSGMYLNPLLLANAVQLSNS